MKSNKGENWGISVNTMRALQDFVIRINAAKVDFYGNTFYDVKTILASLELFASLGYDTYNGVAVDDILDTARRFFGVEKK